MKDASKFMYYLAGLLILVTLFFAWFCSGCTPLRYSAKTDTGLQNLQDSLYQAAESDLQNFGLESENPDTNKPPSAIDTSGLAHWSIYDPISVIHIPPDIIDSTEKRTMAEYNEIINQLRSSEGVDRNKLLEQLSELRMSLDSIKHKHIEPFVIPENKSQPELMTGKDWNGIFVALGVVLFLIFSALGLGWILNHTKKG